VKYLIFSDLHAHNYREFSEIDPTGVNSRLLDCVEVLGEIQKYANSQGIEKVIFCGDLFHLKNNIDSRVIKIILDEFHSLFSNKRLYLLPGNHDYRMWGSDPTLLELLYDYMVEEGGSRVQIITESTVIEDDGVKLYFEPYTRQVKGLNERIASKAEKDMIFIGHQDVVGAYYGGYQVTSGLDPKLLAEKFLWAFVGHNHTPSKFSERVISVGAPLQHNFSDIGSERGWWVLDTDAEELTFVENTFSPKFWEVKVGETIPGNPERDFYRVVLESLDVPPEVEKLRWKRFIYNLAGSSKRRSEIRFQDKTEDIVRKYVELRAPKGFDKKKLIEIGKEYLQ